MRGIQVPVSRTFQGHRPLTFTRPADKYRKRRVTHVPLWSLALASSQWPLVQASSSLSPPME